MGRWRTFIDARLRRILRDSSWMLGATAISAVLGIVQVLLVTRLLGADRYGKLALIMAISITVRQLIGVRIWEWAMKEFADAYATKDAAHAGDVVRRGYVAGLVVNLVSLAIVASAASFAAERFVHDRSATVLVLAYGAVLLVSWTYDTSFAVLRVIGRFRFLATQQVAMATLRIVVTGGSVALWRRLDTTVLAYIVVEVVASLWLAWAASMSFRAELGIPWWRAPRRKRSRKQMARLIAIGSVIDTLKLAAGRLDLLVLGWFRPPAVVANYQAAWNFIDLAQRVTQPVTMVAFADLAKLGAKGQGKEVLRVVGKLSIIALALTLPVCALLYLGAPLLCDLVYGPGYPDAPALLQWLSFSLVWLTGLWMLPSFVSLGKPLWGLEVVAIMTAIKVALLFALAKDHGATGIAIANLAYCLSVPLLIPIYLHRMRRWVHSPAYARLTTPQAPVEAGEASA